MKKIFIILCILIVLGGIGGGMYWFVTQYVLTGGQDDQAVQDFLNQNQGDDFLATGITTIIIGETATGSLAISGMNSDNTGQSGDIVNTGGTLTGSAQDQQKNENDEMNMILQKRLEHYQQYKEALNNGEEILYTNLYNPEQGATGKTDITEGDTSEKNEGQEPEQEQVKVEGETQEKQKEQKEPMPEQSEEETTTKEENENESESEKQQENEKDNTVTIPVVGGSQSDEADDNQSISEEEAGEIFDLIERIDS